MIRFSPDDPEPHWALEAVGWIVLIGACLFLAGCTTYHERFTQVNPDGTTNHVVHVSHTTFLVWGKAAELRTETQTMEFIRTVNAKDIEFKTDSDAIKAVGAAIGEAAGEIIKKQYNPIP